MNKYNAILAVIIPMLSHNITFSMHQPKNYNSSTIKKLDQLPPISFYSVSTRDDLWRDQMLDKHETFLPYPHLSDDFIRNEPYCIHWYNEVFQKISQRNMALLKQQNISNDALDRYYSRITAEKTLTRILCESSLLSIYQAMPSFFRPQYYTVTTDEKLRSTYIVNNHGFYSYPQPEHGLINANILTNVYNACLKLNIERARYIGLNDIWIDTHEKIISALLERYQYDLAYANNITQGDRSPY